MILKALMLVAIAASSAVAASAQVPDPDIWVADLTVRPKLGGSPEILVGHPVNVTRREGYDNQPAFLPGGSGIYFVSADTAGSTDVYYFDFPENRTVRITATPESEYSPTPLPGGGGFSTVRVEADSTQRLWRFDLTGKNPALVMSQVDSVGYHCWIDENTLAIFVVGEPHTLRVVDVPTEHERIIARGIGRSILRVPRETMISFIVQETDTTYAFHVFDDSGATQRLVPALGTSQDAAWVSRPLGTEHLVSRHLLMASGAVIYASDPFSERSEWRPVAHLSEHGIESITRIVVSPDQQRIAFVAVSR